MHDFLFFRFKGKLSQKLQNNAKSAPNRKITKKPIKKQELAEVVSLIRRKGGKIKSRLHAFLEKSVLKSTRHVDWTLQTIQDIYKPTQIKELETFLNAQKPIEKIAMFYFMDDNTFEKLSPVLKEKGRMIKKLIERDLKQVFHEEDEIEEVIDSDEERQRDILNILDSPEPASAMKLETNVNVMNGVMKSYKKFLEEVKEEDDEVIEKIEEEDIKFAKKSPNKGIQFIQINGKKSVNSAKKSSGKGGDYISDEEIELVESLSRGEKEGDYLTGDDKEKEEKESNESSDEEEKEKENQDLRDKIILQDIIITGEDGEISGDRVEIIEEEINLSEDSEYEDDEPLEELEGEGQDEEEGHDFEGLSFCTNSDISEIFYDEYSDYKANEEAVMEKVYTHYLADHNILENYHNVIISLNEESVKDILIFFVSDHYYDFRYPTVELNNNVETYYRQLELLMINPFNQIKLLNAMTFAINCPYEYSSLPTLTEKTYLNFILNILQFLHFYARSNPQSFFKDDFKDNEQYSFSLKNLIKDDFLQQSSHLMELSFISRIMALYSLKEIEGNEFLARKIINLLCYIARVSSEKNILIKLESFELGQLSLITSSKHCFHCSSFRKRVGKLLKFLGKVPEYKEVFLNIEKKIIQDDSQELLSSLTDKYEQINEIYRRIPTEEKLFSFEEVNELNNILQCPHLELYCEILKSIDDHLASNTNTMLVINFMEKLKDSGYLNKMISIICQILIMMKKIRELNDLDFPVVVPSIESYIFTLVYMYYLLRQAKDYGDKKLKTLKSMGQKNSVELVRLSTYRLFNND